MDIQAAEEGEQEDGTYKKQWGKEPKDVPVKLRRGDKKAVEPVKTERESG